MSTLPLLKPEPLRAYRDKTGPDETGMTSPITENGLSDSNSTDRDSAAHSSNTPTAGRARFLGIRASPSMDGSNSNLSLSGIRQNSYLSLASLSFARNSASGLLGFVPSSLTPSDTEISLEDTHSYPGREGDGQLITARRFKRSNFSIFINSVVLFLLGYASAKIFDTLYDRHEKVLSTYIPMTPSYAHWSVLCGFSGWIAGVVLPLLDIYTPMDPSSRRKSQIAAFEDTRLFWDRAGWSMAIRYVGGVIGFAWAASKLEWSSEGQIATVLASVSIGLWFLFDRTRNGFFLSTLVGLAAFFAVYGYHFPNILRTQTVSAATWIPSVAFSFCVAFGNAGRLLYTDSVVDRYSSQKARYN